MHSTLSHRGLTENSAGYSPSAWQGVVSGPGFIWHHFERLEVAQRWDSAFSVWEAGGVRQRPLTSVSLLCTGGLYMSNSGASLMELCLGVAASSV